MNTRHFLLLAASCAALAAAGAQSPVTELRGRVLLADSVTGAAGIVVVARDPARGVVVRAMSGEKGDYALALPGPARYSISALRIGFRPTVLPSVDVVAPGARVVDIVLNGVVVSLPAVTVRSDNVCRTPQDSGGLVAQLWDQARTALSAASLSTAGSLDAAARVYELTLDTLGLNVRDEETSVLHGSTLRPFASLPPDTLARLGYVTEDKSGVEYRAPDADVLLSDSFAALHCLRAERPPADHPEWVGIGVRPMREREGIHDITGTLWLDRASAELRSFDFLFSGLDDELARARAGGHVEFLRLSSGHWIVSRWSLRMPQTTIQRREVGFGASKRFANVATLQSIHVKGGEMIDVQREGAVLYHSAEAELTAARPTVPAPLAAAARAQRARGTASGVLSGRVTQAGDTLGVAGAQIELLGTSVLHWADNDGRFRFQVPPGYYDVRVRMLGYQPWKARMEFADGRSDDRTIPLKRLPNVLTEVRIEGRPVKVPARFEDVYRRGALGFGKFFTREDIERLHPFDVQALLQTIPGILVDDRGVRFQRCTSDLSGLSPATGGGAPLPAKVKVYIDGLQVSKESQSQTLDTRLGAPTSGATNEDDVDHTLRSIRPTAIQAMEVYRGVGQIPGEFLSDACAVIAIWTKAY